MIGSCARGAQVAGGRNAAGHLYFGRLNRMGAIREKTRRFFARNVAVGGLGSAGDCKRGR